MNIKINSILTYKCETNLTLKCYTAILLDDKLAFEFGTRNNCLRIKIHVGVIYAFRNFFL